MTTRLPIAILISGGGTTLRNLIECQAKDSLPIDIRLVISSSVKAAGLRIAANAGIPLRIITIGQYPDPQDFSVAYFKAIRQSGAQIVVMAGFLKYLPIPRDFENRVVNIHPSLIPEFCGAGMYGKHVHQAVLDSDNKVSGCTVHFVDNQFDHGPVIAQQIVPVLDNDTAETLAARIFQAECLLYPQVLRLLADGNVQVSGHPVVRIE